MNRDIRRHHTNFNTQNAELLYYNCGSKQTPMSKFINSIVSSGVVGAVPSCGGQFFSAMAICITIKQELQDARQSVQIQWMPIEQVWLDSTKPVCRGRLFGSTHTNASIKFTSRKRSGKGAIRKKIPTPKTEVGKKVN